MKKVFCRPKSMTGNVFHYCAGCGHSITHRLIAEVIDEMDIRGITIGVPPARLLRLHLLRDLAMCCGGEVEVYLEPLDAPRHPPHRPQDSPHAVSQRRA